jgi:hypothetical protein
MTRALRRTNFRRFCVPAAAKMVSGEGIEPSTTRLLVSWRRPKTPMFFDRNWPVSNAVSTLSTVCRLSTTTKTVNLGCAGTEWLDSRRAENRRGGLRLVEWSSPAIWRSEAPNRVSDSVKPLTTDLRSWVLPASELRQTYGLPFDCVSIDRQTLRYVAGANRLDDLDKHHG